MTHSLQLQPRAREMIVADEHFAEFHAVVFGVDVVGAFVFVGEIHLADLLRHAGLAQNILDGDAQTVKADVFKAIAFFEMDFLGGFMREKIVPGGVPTVAAFGIAFHRVGLFVAARAQGFEKVVQLRMQRFPADARTFLEKFDGGDVIGQAEIGLRIDVGLIHPCAVEKRDGEGAAKARPARLGFVGERAPDGLQLFVGQVGLEDAGLAFQPGQFNFTRRVVLRIAEVDGFLHQTAKEFEFKIGGGTTHLEFAFIRVGLFAPRNVSLAEGVSDLRWVMNIVLNQPHLQHAPGGEVTLAGFWILDLGDERQHPALPRLLADRGAHGTLGQRQPCLQLAGLGGFESVLNTERRHLADGADFAGGRALGLGGITMLDIPERAGEDFFAIHAAELFVKKSHDENSELVGVCRLVQASASVSNSAKTTQNATKKKRGFDSLHPLHLFLLGFLRLSVLVRCWVGFLASIFSRFFSAGGSPFLGGEYSGTALFSFLCPSTSLIARFSFIS